MTAGQATEEIALNLRGFPRDLQKRLRIRAAEEDRTMADIVAEAVEKYLDGKPKRQ